MKKAGLNKIYIHTYIHTLTVIAVQENTANSQRNLTLSLGRIELPS